MKRTIFVIAFLILLISIPILTEANDSLATESEIPLLQKQEVKLPWYKNMNYTFGYNIGLCLRGEDLNNSPSDISLDIIRLISGVIYSLNSIEAGVRIPINNRIIETGFGYGWGNINSANFETRFRDTLINNIIINRVRLGFRYAKKLYIYTGYSISKSIYTGLELNYCQGYGDEEYDGRFLTNTFGIENIRRDLIGGGCYIKLSPTITLNEYSRINPYLMFKISGSYEIHSTSPYSGLWDKKLTVWYTGLYGGFNFNIGGKR